MFLEGEKNWLFLDVGVSLRYNNENKEPRDGESKTKTLDEVTN